MQCYLLSLIKKSIEQKNPLLVFVSILPICLHLSDLRNIFIFFNNCK